jgi:hypothetical protein
MILFRKEVRSRPGHAPMMKRAGPYAQSVDSNENQWLEHTESVATKEEGNGG